MSDFNPFNPIDYVKKGAEFLGDGAKSALGLAEEGYEDWKGEHNYQYSNPNYDRTVIDPALRETSDYGQQRSWGSEDAANAQAGQYAGMAGSLYGEGLGAQGRAGAQESQWMSDLDAQARGDMTGAVGLARDAAMGLAPSEAAYQLQSGLDRASAAQSASAGGARGAAALANAQGNAAMATAGLQADAFNQAGQMRAAEMANARNAYGQMSGQLRASDQSRLGMGNDMAKFNQSQNDQYGLGMLNAGANYGQLGIGQSNVALGYGNLGRGYGTDSQHLGMGQSQMDDNRNRYLTYAEQERQARQYGIAAQNAEARQTATQRLLGAASNGVNSLSGLPKKREVDVRTNTYEPPDQ